MKKLLFIFLMCLMCCSCTSLVYDTTPGYNKVYCVYDYHSKPIYINHHHHHHKPKKHPHNHKHNHKHNHNHNHKPNKPGHRK